MFRSVGQTPTVQAPYQNLRHLVDGLYLFHDIYDNYMLDLLEHRRRQYHNKLTEMDEASETFYITLVSRVLQ